MSEFKVVAPYAPAGDQPQAIEQLAAAIGRGEKFMTLLGITGSGKSATVAWTIEATGKPALVIAPNKSLAAQLAVELGELLPSNRVVYFVSYYDYYRPEAYVPASDTFVEKEATINAEINMMRHRATASLLSRRDVVVVASVSCVYGLGDPAGYEKLIVTFDKGADVDLTDKIEALVTNGYSRNDTAPGPGQFRVRGDIIEIHPTYSEAYLRIQIEWDQVSAISEHDNVTGDKLADHDDVTIWPASHFAADSATIATAVTRIGEELNARAAELKAQGKIVEAARLEQRTRMDMEMLTNTGRCAGIENYSRHMEGRAAGEAPHTLLDYFADDYVCFIDESHIALPQLRGTYASDASRKQTLVDHGFRLPSAKDNRPLRIEEILERMPQVVFVSATPGPDEISWSTTTAELIVRPTGLLDPPVTVVRKEGQLADLLMRIERKQRQGWRTLVTTTTKKMAEDVVEWLTGNRVKARYLHSDIDTVERIQILRELRLGEFDVLVGINLLREGLDLPEVALVAVLDADTEGLFRSTTSLIQTFGRAARNAHGEVVCYADNITPAMRAAIGETERRREKQQLHNTQHGITPVSVATPIRDLLVKQPARKPATPVTAGADADTVAAACENALENMLECAANRQFEQAARWRDELDKLEQQLEQLTRNHARPTPRR